MFQITIQDKTYHVDFKHFPGGTNCIITEGNKPNEEYVSDGSSFRNENDTPCKVVGRKYALKRALLLERDGQHIFDEPTRTLFWDKYHELSRGTK